MLWTFNRIRDVVVFIVGGATYEEAAKIAAINAQSGGAVRIVLGGTIIHNSSKWASSFLPSSNVTNWLECDLTASNKVEIFF